MNQAPHLFVSYSWANPDHEKWVINLASELVENGIHVVLDKWDLKEGHDSIAFMEKMVTDPSISKVILVCDQTYVAKADGRKGGVGTETQIISAELYAKTSQDKFVAVLAEKSENGEPFLPTYYKSRIYIDLSGVDEYLSGFESLLRWVFDRPFYERPELGDPPSFVTEQALPSLGTTTLARRVTEGFKSDKSYARGALEEYLSAVSENLERFRMVNPDGASDDEVVESIENLLAPRNEVIEVLRVLVRYGDVEKSQGILHRFFESLLPYVSRPPGSQYWRETDCDNFRFLVHELFLYAVALLLQSDQVDAARFLLSEPYIVHRDGSGIGRPTRSFVELQQPIGSLKLRTKRLDLRRLSLQADILKERTKMSGVRFEQLMQADLVCFLRAEFTSQGLADRWRPETLVYAGQMYGPFEVFARAVSRERANKILSLLGVPDLVTLNKLVTAFGLERGLPTWGFESFSPGTLIGIDQLGQQQ